MMNFFLFSFFFLQISAEGHVLTWGKGRYGRLGHADSEDQLKPKVVEMLLGYRAVDIACGSGDAQTLCITDDGKKDFTLSGNSIQTMYIFRQRLVMG